MKDKKRIPLILAAFVFAASVALAVHALYKDAYALPHTLQVEFLFEDLSPASPDQVDFRYWMEVDGGYWVGWDPMDEGPAGTFTHTMDPPPSEATVWQIRYTDASLVPVQPNSNPTPTYNFYTQNERKWTVALL